MCYTITDNHDRKQFRYTIEPILIHQRIENCKLIARNNPLTLVSDRPLFRNKGLIGTPLRKYALPYLSGYLLLS